MPGHAARLVGMVVTVEKIAFLSQRAGLKVVNLLPVRKPWVTTNSPQSRSRGEGEAFYKRNVSDRILVNPIRIFSRKLGRRSVAQRTKGREDVSDSLTIWISSESKELHKRETRFSSPRCSASDRQLRRRPLHLLLFLFHLQVGDVLNERDWLELDGTEEKEGKDGDNAFGWRNHGRKSFDTKSDRLRKAQKKEHVQENLTQSRSKLFFILRLFTSFLCRETITGSFALLLWVRLKHPEITTTSTPLVAVFRFPYVATNTPTNTPNNNNNNGNHNRCDDRYDDVSIGYVTLQLC